MTNLVARYEAQRLWMAKIEAVATMQQQGEDVVDLDAFLSSPQQRNFTVVHRSEGTAGKLRVNWWAVLGGAICAVTVLLEIALVRWFLR